MSKNEIPETPKSWAVFVLKVVAYAVGLLLAGVGTASAANYFTNL